MIKYLLFIGLLLANPAHALDEIAFVIRELSPHVTEKQSLVYANSIRRYSIQYNIDWKIAVAIFKRESNFTMGAVETRSRDYGLGQINHRNITHRNINKKKLLTDPDYAIHETYKILDELNRKYNTNAKGWRKWYTRYHSFTPVHRQKYYTLLEQKFNMIKGALDERKKDQKKTYVVGEEASIRSPSHR